MSYHDHDLDHDELVEALRGAESDVARLRAEVARLRTPPRLVWRGRWADGFDGDVYHIRHHDADGWGWEVGNEDHLCDSEESAKAACQANEDKRYAEMLERPR